MCRMIDQGTLAVMVCEELQVRISSRGKFTAYDITRSLRHKQPQTDIPHAQVRLMVHHYMDELVCVDEYQAGLRRFGWKTAILYKPAAGQARRGIPGVPLLPMN